MYPQIFKLLVGIIDILGSVTLVFKLRVHNCPPAASAYSYYKSTYSHSGRGRYYQNRRENYYRDYDYDNDSSGDDSDDYYGGAE